MAATLNNLARALREQGRYDEADALQEALNITRGAFGNDHQLVAIYAINLASIQLARNQPAAAETLLREGLRIRSRAPGSCRFGGARCARTTGVSAPPGACSAPASSPNGVTPKPRTCCSTPVGSWRSCRRPSGAQR